MMKRDFISIELTLQRLQSQSRELSSKLVRRLISQQRACSYLYEISTQQTEELNNQRK